MELSAKLLHDVEFKERWRGYDPDEVDAFLEQVARGVEALQERLREVERTERAGRNGRVERAEVREAPREVRDPRDTGTEDELRRVLVLAQRTADTAVREAREEAERLVAEATSHSEQVTSTGDAYGARVRREADEDVARRIEASEAEVAAAGAGALQRLNDEVARLEGQRDGLLAVVAVAESHLSEHRARAQQAVEQLQRLVDDPASLGAVPMGVVATAAAAGELVDPELEGDELAWDDEDDDVLEDALDEDALEEDDQYQQADELDGVDEDDDDDGEDDDEAVAIATEDVDEYDDEDDVDEDEPAVIDLVETPSLLDVDNTGELYLELDQVPPVAWGDAGAVEADDGGLPTQAMAPVAAAAEIDDDAYLAELRQAIAADEPLSPAAEDFFNQAAYEDDRWKGLRRRR